MIQKSALIVLLATMVLLDLCNGWAFGEQNRYVQEDSDKQYLRRAPVEDTSTRAQLPKPSAKRYARSASVEECLEAKLRRTLENSCLARREEYVNNDEAIIRDRIAEPEEFLHLHNVWDQLDKGNSHDVTANQQSNQSNVEEKENLNFNQSNQHNQIHEQFVSSNRTWDHLDSQKIVFRDEPYEEEDENVNQTPPTIGRKIVIKRNHLGRVIVGPRIYNKTHNPCTRELPTKPSFKKPGLRISAEKCLEFIWDIKAKQDKLQKRKECSKYNYKYLGIPEHKGFIGGRLAEPGEFPHMGALGWKAVNGTYIFKCGGSIISPKFMITAGHCTRSARDPRVSNQEPEIVRIGSKDLQMLQKAGDRIIEIKEVSNYPIDINITKIIRHPCYHPPEKYYDIALIELENSLIFDKNVQAACLWNNLNTDKIEKASAGGWGVTEVGKIQTSSELRAGDLDLINNDTCDGLLRPMYKRLWCGLEEHQMCAGKLAGGTDTCQGDSGGPLQVPINLPPSIDGKIYYLLGVTSFGFGCARPNSPGVYTRVASVIDWIEQNVWPNEVPSENKQ